MASQDERFDVGRLSCNMVSAYVHSRRHTSGDTHTIEVVQMCIYRDKQVLDGTSNYSFLISFLKLSRDGSILRLGSRSFQTLTL